MPETLHEYASRVFGLQPHCPPPPMPVQLPLPQPGTVCALIGPSGAGKTRALEALAAAHAGSRAVSGNLPLARTKRVHELFAGVPGRRAFAALAACGLADGRIWALRVERLSAGEKARLRLALALDQPGQLLIADEWDSHLDFDCARALGQNLGRLARRLGLRVFVSTHRPELLPWLQPARLFALDGTLTEQPCPAPRNLADELTFKPGTLADWQHFAPWHYLGHGKPGPCAAVHVAHLAGRAVAIAVFGFPHLLLSARRGVLGPAFGPQGVLRQGAAALNANVRLLSRVVVDPRLRGCGVGSALLVHALPQLGVPLVECLAQMGDHCGFLAQAGFQRHGQVAMPRAARRLSEYLHAHELDLQHLLQPARRRLLCESNPHLRALIEALANSRIQSGHGALRHGRGNREALVTRALCRLHAQPGYFLWRSPA